MSLYVKISQDLSSENQIHLSLVVFKLDANYRQHVHAFSTHFD